MFLAKGVTLLRDVFVDGIATARYMEEQHRIFVMRSILVIGLTLLGSAKAIATVNVSFTSQAQTLQNEFIANATSQYLGTLVPSPYFAGTYTLTISGKNPAYQPNCPACPACPPPSSNCTLTQQQVDDLIYVSTTTYPQGFANGMDAERCQNVKSLWNTWSIDMASGTCAGQYIPPTASSQAIQGICSQAFQVMISTVSQRWNYIYDTSGACIAP